ncbi:Nitrogenase molybdenum-iron protein [Pseudomonas syringae pv. actinidiae]|uniref:Nitrogenase molybdenum-iron protein n=1 Tax=Pseudomonas syringae pv. actinidiae TaxID=103796 RepID=A0A2V0Q6E2_PSESF|nr:Nitrogenase molybdenum-iron protein [Pseudomonas syringae pv. actinidiae]
MGQSHIFNLDSGGFSCLATKIKTLDERPQCNSGGIKNGGFSASVGGNKYGQMRIEVDLEFTEAAIVLHSQYVEPHSIFSGFVIWPSIWKTPSVAVGTAY